MAKKGVKDWWSRNAGVTRAMVCALLDLGWALQKPWHWISETDDPPVWAAAWALAT